MECAWRESNGARNAMILPDLAASYGGRTAKVPVLSSLRGFGSIRGSNISRHSLAVESCLTCASHDPANPLLSFSLVVFFRTADGGVCLE